MNQPLTNTPSKKRILYWDVAKGITISLVILGHISSLHPIIRRIIFSYHMPFFFIANAYFIRNYNIREHIRKSSRSLLIPYGIVCILSAVLCVNQNAGPTPNYSVFLYRIIDMIAGMSKSTAPFETFQSVWLVWFVICLFAARILYVMLMTQLQKYPWWLQIIVFALLASAGMLIGMKVACLPWSLDVALAALPLMWFGDYLHKSGILDQFNLKIACTATVIWGILGISGIQIEFVPRFYPGHYLSLITAIAGSIFIISAAQIIEKISPFLTGFLAWCGKNSMIILAFHCLEMRFFQWSTNIFSFVPASNWILLFIMQYSLILLLSWGVVQVKDFIAYLNAYQDKADHAL